MTVEKVTLRAHVTQMPGLEVSYNVRKGMAPCPPLASIQRPLTGLVAFLSPALGQGLAKSDHRKGRLGQVHSGETSRRLAASVTEWKWVMTSFWENKGHRALSQREGFGF